MNPYLEISDPAASTKRLEIPRDGTDLVVGRSADCALIIASGAVSRRHARIRRENDQVTIEDLGSSNGTLVNGKSLSAPAVLKDQDRISFGSVEALFVAPAPEAEATVTLSRPPAEVRAEAPPPPSPEPAPVLAPAAPAPPPQKTASATGSRTTETRPLASPASGRSTVAEAPSLAELAAIAFGSFLTVFAAGWVLLRYVF